MTTDELRAAFEAHNDEYLAFEKITEKLHARADLHAFLLLDKLCPRAHDMVTGAEHDEIYLDVEPDEIAATITEAQVIELVRCGVRIGEYGFCMFA